MKSYINFTKFLIVWVFLVILAGSVVRMTQSGMGCPDWPTCFGKWIPPTSVKDLPPDYEKYLKQQDIDKTFNVYHTWIESINRYLGALLGIWILMYVVWSFRKFYKTQSRIFWLSLLLLIAVGLQAWLGKKVVDANLAVAKITTHLLVALFIAAIPIVILQRINNKEKIKNNFLKWLTTISLLALTAQIILGTNVRQQIDVIAKAFNYTMRPLWIAQLNNVFNTHRSFSWVVLIGVSIIFIQSYKINPLKKQALLNLVLVFALMVLGITMAYFNIPAIAQPLHMLCSSVLIISLFSFRLQLK